MDIITGPRAVRACSGVMVRPSARVWLDKRRHKRVFVDALLEVPSFSFPSGSRDDVPCWLRRGRCCSSRRRTRLRCWARPRRGTGLWSWTGGGWKCWLGGGMRLHSRTGCWRCRALASRCGGGNAMRGSRGAARWGRQRGWHGATRTTGRDAQSQYPDQESEADDASNGRIQPHERVEV